MRVTMVIPSMDAGGAERVMSVMANYWAAKKWQVTLITLASGSKAPFYKLDTGIRYVPLGVVNDSSGILSGFYNNFKRIKILRREIIRSQAQAVISFIDSTNVISIIATIGTAIPIIVSERNDPFMWKIGWVWDKLRKLTYPLADKIVLQSERVKSYYGKKVIQKAIIIPNPIAPPDNSDENQNISLKKPSVVAMGRLDHGKGFDILLKAFASARRDNSDWSLTIIGDGPLHSTLEALIKELGLKGEVIMPGIVKNPFHFLKEADIFVLSSRNEGFPMALCEAMACGAPVISSDCNEGLREIITDGTDGILVPPEDISSLSDAMLSLMKDKAKRIRMGKNAVKIVDKFGVEKVMGMWTNLVETVATQ